ncbi:putative repeat protein (TIGR01451 family) [Streptosporangium becharense]|uniref:Putative repeat protein (TIGR01451 family) n=1 Tax=Streptosporangium becharense TaxID=1816182 RepID=A0A7W9MK36_9ACTN|nr:PKD domain-containing protein [Streptosporangium becharense]MBB2910470.1 putative repeat protein (TIGR01451 family) [Streptosporangium becharense]MBB5823213.1 putative repeat protein (TIGR01451 family) [Streptosporangium becharense]
MATTSSAKFTDLGSLDTHQGVVGGINNKGQIAAAINRGTLPNEAKNGAVLFSGAGLVDIHASLGDATYSTARDVNEDGTVVGTYQAQNEDSRTFVFKDGKATRFNNLYLPRAINDKGQIVGASWIRDTDGSVLKLSSFKDQYIEVYSLNNSGLVAGGADMNPDPKVQEYRAFRIAKPGEPVNVTRDRLEFMGDSTVAFDVNDSGQVAGYGVDRSGGYVPLLWEANGRVKPMTTDHGGMMNAINSAGIGVGKMYDFNKNFVAAMYANGTGIDLNTLVSTAGLKLTEATDINDDNQITGIAKDDENIAHAFRIDLNLAKPRIDSFELDTQLYPSKDWVPVPEKGTVEGNQVRATVTLHNPGSMPARRTLEVVEDGTGRVVRNGRRELTLGAGETVTEQVVFPTEGLAWRDGQPYSNRSVTARVLNGFQDESKDTKPIVIRPMPVALVHGWNSNAGTWGKYAAFLKAAHPLLTGRAVGTLSTGVSMYPHIMTYPLPLNASMLGREIEELRQAEDAGRVNIVAHSMGGTISREYIAQEMRWIDDKPVVARLIQMGTPNLGSPCADMIVQWANGANVGVPWYPATWENTTTYMQEEFNPKTKNLKGVLVSNLVGTGHPLLCGTKVRGTPIPEPGTPTDSDKIVPTWSARGDLKDTPGMHILHTRMTGSQEVFNDYVKPRLASLPTGGSADVPGLREAAPATGDEKTKPEAEAEAEADGDDSGDTRDTDSLFAFPEATVETGQTASVPLDVPQGTQFGVVGALPETVGLLLRDPSGKPAAQYTAGSEEAKEVVQGLSVTTPRAGAWKLEITNTGAEPVQAALGAWIAGNPVTVTATAEASEEGKVTVTATVADGGEPVTGASARAVATLGDGTRKEVTLADDGDSGDGAAGDGTYGGVTEALADGVYPVTVLAETAKGVRTTLESVKVAKPDTREFELELSAQPGGSVTASPAQEKYRAGTEVTVTATPEAGRVPTGWTVDGQERPAGTLRLVMDGPHTVVARFGSYTVAEIGGLPGGKASKTKAVALNDRSQVAATAVDKDDRSRAVRWQDGTVTDLGGLPCTDGPGSAGKCRAAATGINEAGDVSGWATVNRDSTVDEHAVVYRNDGAVTDLQSSSTTGHAYDLNDNGQVFGNMSDSTGNSHVLWEKGKMVRLPGMPKFWTGVMPTGRINARGAVAGAHVTSEVASGPQLWEPAVHQDGVITKLAVPVCRIQAGVAHDVNDTGLVAGGGTCNTGSTVTHHAYTWQDGERTDLGEGVATAVNNHGLVAGMSGGPAVAAPALWLDGKVYKLAELLPRPLCPADAAKTTEPCMGLTSLLDVNSAGQILAQGFVRDRSPAAGGFPQEERSFLLSPTSARADLEVTHTVSVTEPGPGSKVTWTTTVTNKGDDAATDVRLDVMVPQAAGTATCDTWRGVCAPIKDGFRNTVKLLEPGWKATVEVSATLPAGITDGTELKTQVRAASLAVTDPDPGDNTASATATVRHVLDRTAIDWPKVRVGESGEWVAVKLTNRGNDPMPITAIAAEEPFAQRNDCPVELAVGASCVTEVTFAPAREGDAAGKLTFTTARGADPAHVVTLTGQGTAANARPVIEMPAAPLHGEVNQPFTLSVKFSDADTTDTHTAQVAWGDGPPVPAGVTQGPGGGTVTATRTFTAARQGAAVVLVTDSKGDTTGQPVPYVIEKAAPNTAPVVTAGPDVELTMGETLHRVVSFADPDSTSWTAAVDYGDGAGPAPVTPAGQKITLEHRWATAGTYPVIVTVRDDGGLQTSATFLATVVPAQTPNQAPQVKLTGPGTAEEGTAWTGTGTVTDADSTSWTATVDYGDGAGPKPLPVTDGRLTLKHVAADNGDRKVVVTVTDDKGAVGTAELTVAVANRAPEVSIKEPAVAKVVAVGVPVSLSASFTDPGTADTHTATWKIGGQQLPAAVAGTGGAGTVTGTHTFTKAGRYPIAVTVTDDDGAATTADAADGDNAYVLVHDPAGSLVGAGQVASPAGSCRLSAGCGGAGKATFAVTARYPRKGGTPSGVLTYHAPGFTLRDSAYTVLAAADGTAILRGTGRVNTTTEVTFEITAVDSGKPFDRTDQLRVKAWDENRKLVYDNQPAGSAPTVTGVVRVSG